LILVAFSLLIFQPLVLFDLSFQLSFLSVASIILFVPRWEAFLLRRSEQFFSKSWIRRPLEVVLASLAVQVGLFPVLVQRFHQISFVSLPANLVLVPAFSLLLMPLGMLGMLFSWLASTWAGPFFLMAVAVLKPLVAFLQFLASLPMSYPYWPGFNLGQLALYYGLILSFFLPLVLRFKKISVAFLLILNLAAWAFPPLWNRWTPPSISPFSMWAGRFHLIRFPMEKDLGGWWSGLFPFDLGEGCCPLFYRKHREDRYGRSPSPSGLMGSRA
jgi:competence protein ComEC